MPPNKYSVDDRAELFVLHKELYNQTDNLGYNKIVEIVSPLEGKVILDYGCGSGDNARILQQHGAKLVIGVEPESSLLENYQKTLKDNLLGISETQDHVDPHETGIIIKKIDYDNKVLPQIIADKSIDTMISHYVFCEIGDINTIREIFSTVYDKLKYGGKILLQMPNRDKFNGKESYGFKCFKKEALQEGDVVQTVLRTNNDNIDDGLLLSDFYRSQGLLKTILLDVGFQTVEIHELYASKGAYEGIVDEMNHSPIYIVDATK